MGPARTVRIEYRRPPDRVDVFRQRLLAARPGALVTFQEHTPLQGAVRARGRIILEDGAPVVWFTFPGRWHDVGRFHRSDGTFTGYYANVLTPVEIDGDTWRTMDLFLDVFVPAWAAPPCVLDEHELEHAVRSGWLDAAMAARARDEAASLLRQTRAGSWPTGVVLEWTLERARDALAGTSAGEGV